MEMEFNMLHFTMCNRILSDLDCSLIVEVKNNDTPRNIQILANCGDHLSSQEEKILTTTRNISTSQNGIEEQKFHEKQVNL